MVTANPNNRFPHDGSKPVPPVNRLAAGVRHCFDQRPELAREKFSLEDLRGARPRLSAEDIRIHAWLNERLAMLDYERHGLWPRLRRFVFGRS
jgi:hypothetical protein